MINVAEIIEHNRKCAKTIAECRRPGPWDNEPHRLNFRHCGLDCMALRNENTGGWCGYLAVNESHPYYGLPRDYETDDGKPGVYGLGLECHGGVTYGDFCSAPICHLDDGEKSYWIGFDCNHGTDAVPTYPDMWKFTTYRNLEYVVGQCQRLAEQLVAVK